MVVPQNSWFIRQYPIEKDDLGVPLFQETPISISPIMSHPNMLVTCFSHGPIGRYDTKMPGQLCDFKGP